MGWAVRSGAKEKKAITNGDTDIQESTYEMYKIGKRGIEECLKQAEKCFEALKPVVHKLQQGGKDTYAGIKARMQSVTNQLPFINEVI